MPQCSVLHAVATMVNREQTYIALTLFTFENIKINQKIHKQKDRQLEIALYIYIPINYIYISISLYLYIGQPVHSY